MKIAVVITSLEVGGAEKTVIELANLLKNDFTIKIYVINRNYHSIYDEAAYGYGLNVIYLNNFMPVFNPFIFWRLKRLFDTFAPDIIHSHLKSSDYVFFYRLFRKNRFKWIHTVHTVPQADCHFFRRLIYRPLYQKRKVNLIAVSDMIKSELLLYYPTACVQVINNGVNTQIFKYNPQPHTNITVCHIGRFVPAKNHAYLVSEFKKVVKVRAGIKMFLIGSGRLKKKIMKYINNNGLENNIKIINCTNHIEDYLKRSDIFVLPSVYEGFPLALLEAMACGLVVIVGTWGEGLIANEFNGFLVEIKPWKLAEAILKAADNIEKYEEIRQRAAMTARDFSLFKTAQMHHDFYMRIYNDKISDNNRLP